MGVLTLYSSASVSEVLAIFLLSCSVYHVTPPLIRALYVLKPLCSVTSLKQPPQSIRVLFFPISNRLLRIFHFASDTPNNHSSHIPL